MIERKINSQRMYKIPFQYLDLLLVKLTMLRTDLQYFEMDWLFKEDDSAVVVINEYGNYPFQFNELIRFINAINTKQQDEKYCEYEPFLGSPSRKVDL